MNGSSAVPAAPRIPLADWMDHLTREYLGGFIKEGGAAVKFAVALDGRAQELIDTLEERARGLDYVVVRVSADETKVHMVDQLFFRIAQQVPWADLSEAVLVRLASARAFKLPVDPGGPILERLARANEVSQDMVLAELRPKIANAVFKNHLLSRDFRVAMTHFCQARLAGGEDGATTLSTLTDWLTGANKAIAAVRPYQIFSRINRTNARHLFESLLHWVRFSGRSGVVVVLDTTRITLSKNPKDEKLWYTKAGVLDTYEVLRQFIDSTDRLSGCLIVVAPDPLFLDDESRGIKAYEALMFRVYDEIRDRSRVNPLGSLVRIAGTHTEGVSA
jgi:hypothetical protein